MKFILIVIIKYIGESVAIESAEFNDQNACIAAKRHLESQAERYMRISAHCYAKGSK